MAYVNVVEWCPDQVSEWLKGLDEAILPYIHYFVNNQVDGKRLLQLSPDDLPSLSVTKIGHQEIILQAVELLRIIHYQLNQENVQYMALRLSSKARSIYNELRQTASSFRNGGGSAGEEEEGEDDEEGAERRNAKKRQERVSTAIIAGVADVLSSVKGLMSWLNRQPFEGQEKYDCLKSDLVELSIRLATIAQRDMFAENQATIILQLCLRLAVISDKIIQEYSDPLIIQPATLDIATMKKKADDEWGLGLLSSYHGVHQVSEVRALSPAYQCGKLQEGDELVQVNYQTVIGWSPHKVAAIMQEFPVEVILTVKKRPRHANTVTQIYLKPMRLPSKKRTYSPWANSLAASPRYDLQSIPNLQLSVSVDKMPLRREENLVRRPKSITPPPQQAAPSPQPPPSLGDVPSTTSDRESEASDSEDDPFLSDSDLAGTSPVSVRLYHPKPRAPVQRRATIPGATTRPSLSFDQLLQDVKWIRGGRGGFIEGSDPSDPDLLRGSGGSDRVARPHTCIGTENKIRLIRERKEAMLKEGGQVECPVKEGGGKSADDTGGKNGKRNADQECLSGEEKYEKKVVNVIPLPPRKPTNYGAATGSHTSSPSVAHRPLLTEDNTNGRVGSPALVAHAQSPSLQYGTVSPDKTINSSRESVQDVSGRPRRVSEDRPKLDKSHSTPAYDLDGDGTLPGVSTSLSSHTERSPATLKSPHSTKHGSSSTNFFSKRDSKTSLGSRRISCRELGQGDHQGWLHRRRDNKGFLLPHRWERRWFILKKNYLYGYRDREAVRADSLIYLPGFHVCPATDVKAKKFAFKIYHSSGATFYFACDTSEERSRWMSQMGLSAITSLASQNRHQHVHQQQGEEVYYSETDEELEERSSPSRRSPQSSQSRTSPSKEAAGGVWRGGSASPSRGSQGRGTSLSSLAGLGSSKSQGLRFLQPSRDPMNQPVPTASFRSYRRVSESSSRSTSTGDLRGVNKTEDSGGQADITSTEGTSGRRVTRKNSLRDRLRQLPAPFTLERRRQATSRGTPNGQDQQKQYKKQQHEEQLELQQDAELKRVDVKVSQEGSTGPLPESTDYCIPNLEQRSADDGRSSLQESSTVGNRQRPHYMLPTRASSQHSPVRPSSVDLDTRSSPSKVGNGRWNGTPPPSGRCSPSKFEVSGRRGSIGGESPVRSRSPRRGSLDCLAWSHPRALSPPISPLHTPTRSSHGSTSSLLASEEYREGSPEKLWINSLRNDNSRPRANLRSSPEKRDGRSRTGSGEVLIPDRLKRAALYHPPQLRNRNDSMRAAFELALDPSSGQVILDNSREDSKPAAAAGPEISSVSSRYFTEQWVQGAATPTKKPQQISNSGMLGTPRPEVPPRTKFLSPSERTLPTSSPSASSSTLVASSSSPSSCCTRSTSSLSQYSSSSQSRVSISSLPYTSPNSPAQAHNTSTKLVPSLTIRTHAEESETIRTPLKPAMGVSMIGKQRRTPSVLSPRDIFFSTPPSSPTPTNQPAAVLSPGSSSVSSISTTVTYPIANFPHGLVGKTSTPTKLRNQKILPHYPGMEYPPVFEPGSYSLCGSPPEQSVYQMPNLPSPHQTDQQTAPHHNFSDMATSCASIETHVMFTVGQAAASPGVTQANNKSTSPDVSLQELPGKSSEGGSQQNQCVSSHEYKTQRNIHVGSSIGTAAHHSVHVIMPVQPNSHQNLYVTSPSGSTSFQNLYVSGPGSGTHQNIYVTSPVSTSHQNLYVSTHQNVYVTTPVRPNTQHNIYVSSPSRSGPRQNINMSSTPGRPVSEPADESSERVKSVCNFSPSAEGQNNGSSGSCRPLSKSLVPPRLRLPGPPDSPPSDDDSEVKSSSTQTESSA
nr:mucin-5AC-like isoform X3 [Procambarus clarkii]